MTKKRFFLAGGALVLFLIILYFVVEGKTSEFDGAIQNVFFSARNEVLNQVVACFTHVGDTVSIVILCLLLLILPWTRKWYGIPVSAAAIVASSMNHYIKGIIQRPRPDVAMHLIEQGGWSFPSGHSITSMVVFGLLIWLVRHNVENKKTANIWTVVLVIPWIGIGLSRIYVGVHYPTDVLAGWCLGIVILMIAVSVVEAVEKRIKLK